MTSTMAPLLEGFSEQATAAKDELATLASCDPLGFRDEALPFIQPGPDRIGDAARRHLLHLLMKYSRLPEYVADPSQSTPEEAIAIAKAAQRAAVPLDAPLERIFTAALRDPNAGPVIIRIIDLFAALLQGKLVLRMQKELLAHPDSRVCSKAVYELVRAGKGPAFVAQMLLQGDPRVQANAVEALWGSDDKNAKAVLLIAAKSPHNRVAANGLVGLYRQGSLESVPQLLRMATNSDPALRASGVWAIGETADPRFLPFLTREYALANSKEKLGIVRALTRIRKQLPSDKRNEIRIALHESRILPDGSRRIVVALHTPGETLTALSPMQFALWEEKELVTQYSTRCLASPPVLVLGFALPRFLSKADPYSEAVSQALHACLEVRRDADPWRLERFLADEQSRAAVKEQVSLVRPDHHSPLALHMKNHKGFLLDPALIREVIDEPGPRERAATDVAAAIEKLADVTSRLSGPRHLFVFFHPENVASNAVTENGLRRLSRSLRDEPLILHGFAPASGDDYALLRELCSASPRGTFQTAPLDQLERAVSETYLGLMGRYEIVYRVNAPHNQVENCELRVSTPVASGLLSFSLNS